MERKIKTYNLRVYGILLDAENRVLLSSEERSGYSFTKFPGGGHKLGEGLIDALEREFMEELGIEIRQFEHFYTTDFFQSSAFNPQEQVISIYYRVYSSEAGQIKDGFHALDESEGNSNRFFWRNVDQIEATELSFPIDQLVLKKLKKGD